LNWGTFGVDKDLFVSSSVHHNNMLVWLVLQINKWSMVEEGSMEGVWLGLADTPTIEHLQGSF